MIGLSGTCETEKIVVCAGLDNRNDLKRDILLRKIGTCVALENNGLEIYLCIIGKIVLCGGDGSIDYELKSEAKGKLFSPNITLWLI